MLTQAGHQQGDIILVADGLSSAESENIATQLKGTNWNLSVMSVGTAQGAPIRLPNGDMFTHDGVTVVAKADINALQSLAQANHGVYTALRSDDADIQILTQALNHVELKPANKTKNRQSWKYILIMVLAITHLAYFCSWRISPWWNFQPSAINQPTFVATSTCFRGTRSPAKGDA